jgi:hypothetical protein
MVEFAMFMFVAVFGPMVTAMAQPLYDVRSGWAEIVQDHHDRTTRHLAKAARPATGPGGRLSFAYEQKQRVASASSPKSPVAVIESEVTSVPCR